LIQRFARDLINSVQNSDLKVGVTVVQIYKDWMFDLLRGDSDISGYLNESYESDGISSVNIESYQQFVSAYQEAFEKGEANSNFMNQNQTKFHLVVRFTLSKGDKKYF